MRQGKKNKRQQTMTRGDRSAGGRQSVRPDHGDCPHRVQGPDGDEISGLILMLLRHARYQNLF